MDFEELQVIWDSQRSEPLYAIDQAALHAHVTRKSRQFDRHVLRRDIRELGVGVLGAAYLVAEGVVLETTGHRGVFLTVTNDTSWLNNPLFFYVAAALIVIGPLLLIAGRFRQAKRERGFDDSLRGDLSRAIAQVGYQTAIFGSISWWYLFPMFCGAVFFLILVCILESQPESLILAGIVMSVAGVLSYWVNRRYIRKRLLPRQRALETLRAKLIDSED